MSRRTLTLVLVSAVGTRLAGCVSTSVTRVGSDTFSPLPETADSPTIHLLI